MVQPPLAGGPHVADQGVAPQLGWIGAEPLNERPTSVRMPTLPQSTSDVVSKCAAELPATSKQMLLPWFVKPQ